MASDRPLRILVILPNNLGDIIMATPVCEGLRTAYPSSYIAFIVEKNNEAGLLHNDTIDEVISFPRQSIKDLMVSGEWRLGTREMIQQIAHCAEMEWDHIINLSQNPFFAYFVSFLRANKITGCQFLHEGNEALTDVWSRYLYAIPFARNYNALHAVDVYRRMAGVTCHRGRYRIICMDSEKQAAIHYLSEKGIDVTVDTFLVFQPGAAYAAKRWPAEHYVTLGKECCARGYRIVLSGAPAEQELVSGIQARIGNGCISTAGETSFRQAIVNLSFAKGCVTGDTALMHAAAGLDVPVFALFGPTSPLETGPYGSGHILFSGRCADRPCFCDTCKSMLCMKSILPETVLYAIEHATAPSGATCDMYITSVQPSGDYRITPLTPDAFPFYDPTGSLVTQRACGGQPVISEISREHLGTIQQETEKIITIITRMENLLKSFLIGRDGSLIEQFEAQKDELMQVGGIGHFWTALLNLGLNSVPVLDPMKGVQRSIDVCSSIVKQLRYAVSIPL